jgi:ACS family hexuronate transporter-like MFS transporter
MSIREPELVTPTGVPGRAPWWRWYVCTLLLLATVVNYMDRLTVNSLAVEIKTAFSLDNEKYGNVELGFGLAFAAGSLLFGWLVDKFGPYYLHPIALIGWSVMGFLTGRAESYEELLWLRVGLGLFEAGHFPCGLKTVQLLLDPRDRALGNSILQSGTALGAIIAPQVIKILMANYDNDWRKPFLVIGVGGCLWVIFWLASVRRRDLTAAASARAISDAALTPDSLGRHTSFFSQVLSWKYLALAIMVVCVNLNWHLFRVWLPTFLREARGYDLNASLNFSTYYYLSADAGALLGGAASGWLARRGMSVFASRMSIFAVCCVLTSMTTVAVYLPSGWPLLAALLLVACGGLGSFTAFYSMTQDLSHEHQGKISGSLSTITWLATATFHPLFGRFLDQGERADDLVHRYELVIGAMGWLPMIALVTTLLLWNRNVASRER